MKQDIFPVNIETNENQKRHCFNILNTTIGAAPGPNIFLQSSVIVKYCDRKLHSSARLTFPEENERRDPRNNWLEMRMTIGEYSQRENTLGRKACCQRNFEMSLLYLGLHSLKSCVVAEVSSVIPRR